MKELLKNIILDQQQLTWNEKFIRRDFPDYYLTTKDIVVISGVRRCGKSTLLHQIRQNNAERDFYFNFDDERLVNFTVEHFQLLHQVLMELFGEQNTFYFDEIQNVVGWERFVRRLNDYGCKVFLTGSNATMLSRELGTHLTGRYLRFELYPFSFAEFLLFKGFQNITAVRQDTRTNALTSRRFGEYFKSGGFPQYIDTGNDLYLKSLYESILYRDVMVRNHLTHEHEVSVLVNYLAGNVSRLISYNSLTAITGIKNPSTIKKYLDFLQDTYLLFQISKYDFSIKKQVQNPKRIYFIDTALVSRLGFSFSENLGRLLENLVFIELRRRSQEVWYHHGKSECDFIIRENENVTKAIQVCYSLADPIVRKRELAGLIEAMESYNLKEGLIITREEQEEIKIDGIGIRVVPIAAWLLTSEK
jgi:predicted AAA+ superfamily ATPase